MVLAWDVFLQAPNRMTHYKILDLSNARMRLWVFWGIASPSKRKYTQWLFVDLEIRYEY